MKDWMPIWQCWQKTEVVSDIFRAKKFDMDAEINVDATNIKTLSKAVLSASKTEGANADVVDKIVDVIGKNADLKDIVVAVKQLGYELSETDLGNVYEEFKKLIANKESIDKKELEALNKIIFPYILDEIEHRVLVSMAAGAKTVVIDGATIIESGCGKLCDALVSVVADSEIRKTRIIKRDNISKNDAERRINAQKPEEFYTENSDFVIHNDSTEAELERNVNSVLKNMVLLKERTPGED